MKLIVGLGNPGIEYALTRHNIGFMVIDHMAANNDFGNEKKGFDGVYYKTKIKGEDFIFFKPYTYMNNSGYAVRQIVDYFKIPLEDVLVIHDDLDLPTGSLRIRERCSSGGHNGIKSIISHLGTDNFKRFRIGIAKPGHSSIIDFVLGKLNEEEKVAIKQALINSSDAIKAWSKLPFNQVMSLYNKKG